MVQASITWKVNDIRISSMINGLCHTIFNINHEWMIVCLWEGYVNESLKPHSVEFRRVSTTETVSISGNIVLLKNIDPHFCIEVLPKLEFQTTMESGSSYLLILLEKEPLEVLTESHKIRLNVNITSLYTSQNEECRNCVHLERLCNDFGRLLEKGSYFPNVILKCGKASISAHKSILSVRSPVFAAMFKSEMKENLENEVVITDMDESVLRLMLTYIYKGHVSDLTVSTASDLLFAADKYHLEDLKNVCCEFLKKNISLQNVLRIASFGDMLCNDLKSRAIHYICNSRTNISVFEESEDWKTIKQQRPSLIIDILIYIVKARENMDKLYKEIRQSLKQ